jgi:hypothetical protein
MNAEPTTIDDDAATRQMMASWTSALLRLRSRPSYAPQRGAVRYAQPPFGVEAAAGRATLSAGR